MGNNLKIITKQNHRYCNHTLPNRYQKVSAPLQNYQQSETATEWKQLCDNILQTCGSYGGYTNNFQFNHQNSQISQSINGLMSGEDCFQKPKAQVAQTRIFKSVQHL